MGPAVETRLDKKPHSDHVTILQAEITALWNQIRLANWSFRMFVTAALVIFLVIVSLCFSEFASFNMSAAIAVFFRRHDVADNRPHFIFD